MMSLPAISMASSNGMAILISFVRLTSSRPSTGKGPTFFGCSRQGLVTDDTHHMGWTAFFIAGVAHGLAVDGEAFVLPGVGFVPALQGAVQGGGFDANQHIADDRLTGHDVTALFATAAEALACLSPRPCAQSAIAR